MSVILQKIGCLHICTRCLGRALTYKSVYNHKNLYPESKDLFLTYSSKPEEGSPDKFDGHIPVKKLTLKYSKSSGPGGQHVNKTLSKVEVRFHVLSADWIPEHLRPIIVEKYRKRITKTGEMIVKNEDSRYQMNNLKNCLEEIRSFIKEAEKRPDTSKEDRIAELNNMDRIQASHKERLVKKRMHSYTKAMRNFDDE